MKIKKFFRELDPFHYLCTGITIGFLALTVFVFRGSFTRIGESCVDLFNSLVYYVDDLFELELGAAPTVNNFSSIPWTPIFGLPATWEEFKVLWLKYWEIFFTAENFSAWLDAFAQFASLLTPILTLMMLVILLCYLYFLRYLSTYNNDRNKDSRPLLFYKRLADYTYIPVKRFIRAFVAFLNSGNIYLKLWCFIWAFNFNFIAILIEFFAYYFYFIISFDLLNLYRQIFKLFCDLSPMIAFLPGFAWVIIGYIAFDMMRKRIGANIIYRHEARNCGFINERPIVTMICGTMGKKKTTMLTDVALLQNKMFREKALKLMVKNELKFPEFPWVNLEHFLNYCMYHHIVYNLTTVKDLIRYLAHCFDLGRESGASRGLRKKLNKEFGYKFRYNLIFDYDYARYGLLYDDGLKILNIWEVIESYAMEFFIYNIDCSYIVSNFSVRTDAVRDDKGNLPIYDQDFYNRSGSDALELSRFSNIINYNALRLGKKTTDEDPMKDSFEFGVVAITEIGKERKNNLQLQELKRKDDSANQKNDGFNDWLKMIRHSATVDYYPFVKVISDEQRPESWGADARDLCDIVHIRESSETKLAMPFFALSELLYDLIFKKFTDLRNEYKHVRADNTVPMWVFRKLTAKLEDRYNRIYNRYGYSVLALEVERGTQDGATDSKKYYLDSKRIYADRFSTDCFSDFFETKSRRSPVGLADYPEYESSKATFDELQLQESYFVEDLIRRKEEFTDKDSPEAIK